MACVMFTSCNNATSIGIIGGADGPTAIFAKDGKTNPKIEPIKMVNIERNLFGFTRTMPTILRLVIN